MYFLASPLLHVHPTLLHTVLWQSPMCLIPVLFFHSVEHQAVQENLPLFEALRLPSPGGIRLFSILKINTVFPP